MTAEASGSATRVAPKLFSKYVVAPNLSIETRLDFEGWNTSAGLLDDTAVETTLKARRPLPLVSEIKTSIWHGPDGVSRQRLGVGLVENLGFDLVPGLAFNTHASFEQTVRYGGTDTLVKGLGASLSGFGSGRGIDSRLSLRYEVRDGPRSVDRSSLAYHRAWRVNDFLRLSLDCEVVTAVDVEHKLRLGWQAKF